MYLGNFAEAMKAVCILILLGGIAIGALLFWLVGLFF